MSTASAVDEAVDAAFEPLRGRPEVDRVAALVSNAADYGAIWVALALWKARRPGPRRRRAILALGSAGVASMLTNRAAKDLVQRQRPADHLQVGVRTPTSSSFPSGHTLAAFATALVLGENNTQVAAYASFATAVAASRVHLRAHHPSDVAGGALIGTALGLGLRPVVGRLVPGASRRDRRHGMGRATVLLERL